MLGGEFDPGSTKYKGCLQGGGVCRRLEVLPEGHTWYSTCAPPKTTDFWLTYKPETGKTYAWDSQFSRPNNLSCDWKGGCSDHVPVFVDTWLVGEGNVTRAPCRKLPGGVRFPLDRYNSDTLLDRFMLSLVDRLTPDLQIMRLALDEVVGAGYEWGVTEGRARLDELCEQVTEVLVSCPLHL